MSTISYFTKKYRTKVSALFGILCLIFSMPSSDSLLFGVLFIIFGQSIRIWSSGHIHKNEVLTVSGPYSISRNPLYVGSFIMGVGFIIAMGVLWIALAFLIFFTVVYLFTIRWEEEKLERKFPNAWPGYKRTVPRFLPLFKIPRYIKGEYRWTQVWKHKELHNAATVIVVYCILWGKALLTG